MLTKEQVRREGTVIPKYHGNVKYRVQFWGNPEELTESDILNRSYEIISYGTHVENDVEFLKVESHDYKGTFPFLIPMTDLQRVGIVETEKGEFKVGDKVKIPKQKSKDSSLADFQRGTQDYKIDYLIIDEVLSHVTTLRRADGRFLGQCNFLPKDLEHYEEPTSNLQFGTLRPMDGTNQSKTNTMDKKIIGYELIQDYPLNLASADAKPPKKLMCKKTDTEWWFEEKIGEGWAIINPHIYPKYWKPIYEEDKIKIGGYELEKDNNVLKIGCVYLNRDVIIFLNKIMKADIAAELTIKGVKITKEMVERAYKMLNQII